MNQNILIKSSRSLSRVGVVKSITVDWFELVVDMIGIEFTSCVDVDAKEWLIAGVVKIDDTRVELNDIVELFVWIVDIEVEFKVSRLIEVEIVGNKSIYWSSIGKGVAKATIFLLVKYIIYSYLLTI